MTEREKEIVRRLMHPVYTVDYLEEWLERKDNVFVNPVAALSAMGGHKGFILPSKRWQNSGLE